MGLIDTLIADQTARAASFSNTAETAITQLRAGSYPLIVDMPADIDINQYTLPAYVAPTNTNNVPTPIYEPSGVSLPTAPVLTGVSSITLPAARTEPVLNTTGLFNFATPSTTLPTLDETNPDLQVDALVAEMDALVTPMLSNYVFPDIHAYTLGPAPDLELPNYVAPPPMDDLGNPVDYAAAFETSYNKMAPAMQSFIDDKANTWVSNYAPEYSTWVTGLKDKINTGFTGQALTDQFEAAMFARAQDRATLDFNTQAANIYSDFSRNGFMEPPGTTTSKLFALRLQRADSIAGQATDVYLKRRETEIQHSQFCMTLASSQITAVRNAAIQYAQQVGVNLATSIDYANQVSGKLMEVYNHYVKRSELRLAVLGVIDTQYNTKVKAVLAYYDGFRIQLDAEKARTDIDVVKVSQITAQMEAEGKKVQVYTALVDAVARKAGLEELKIKEYNIRSDIFGNKIKAQIAGFDMYKAALSGDQSKLEGELSKLKVFESLVGVDKLNLDVQLKQIEAQQVVNESQVAIFRAGADVYKVGTDAALQKFTAQAEVKKLAQNLYGQELMNAIEQYKVGFELPKTMIDAILKQYALRVDATIKQASIKAQELQIRESGAAAAAGAAASVASAAIGALNGVVSSATQISA
jgi:hypothetical protein